MSLRVKRLAAACRDLFEITLLAESRFTMPLCVQPAKPTHYNRHWG